MISNFSDAEYLMKRPPIPENADWPTGVAVAGAKPSRFTFRIWINQTDLK
jgi:hypothetical protein